MEQYEVKYGSFIIPFSLKRTDRKTLGITVKPDTTIEVTAPVNAEIHKVKSKVVKRGRWIRRQQRFFEDFLPATPIREYVSGETHLYLGKQYRLKIICVGFQGVKLEAGRIQIFTPEPHNTDRTKMLLGAWYKGHAERKFNQRLKEVFCSFEKHDIEKPELELKRMKKRWGSCTASGKVILNPELIKSPTKCIDYVITHELCHLIHHHHGKSFYELQTKMMPDWKRWKLKLEKMMV